MSYLNLFAEINTQYYPVDTKAQFTVVNKSLFEQMG